MDQPDNVREFLTDMRNTLDRALSEVKRPGDLIALQQALFMTLITFQQLAAEWNEDAFTRLEGVEAVHKEFSVDSIIEHARRHGEDDAKED